MKDVFKYMGLASTDKSLTWIRIFQDLALALLIPPAVNPSPADAGQEEQKTPLADDRRGQDVPHTSAPSSNPVGLAREIGVQCTVNPLYYHLGTSEPPVLACRYHVLPVLKSTQLHVIPFSSQVRKRELPGLFQILPALCLVIFISLQ